MMTKVKVLVVDDERSFTRLLKANLEAMGEFEVRVENWAEDAWAAAREFRPHVILLDLIMPRMAGGSVRVQLESDPALAAIPIILLTGSVRPPAHPAPQDDELPELWNDGRPYLLKPVTDQQVAAMIRRHVRQGG